MAVRVGAAATTSELDELKQDVEDYNQTMVGDGRPVSIKVQKALQCALTAIPFLLPRCSSRWLTRRVRGPSAAYPSAQGVQIGHHTIPAQGEKVQVRGACSPLGPSSWVGLEADGEVVRPQMGDSNKVGFYMLHENSTETIDQLRSIRAKPTKFICLNDNMDDPDDEVHGTHFVFVLASLIPHFVRSMYVGSHSLALSCHHVGMIADCHRDGQPL